MRIVGIAVMLLLAGCEDHLWHEYRFLCRSELKRPAGDGGYDVVLCVPDNECIKRSSPSSLTLGCAAAR